MEDAHRGSFAAGFALLLLFSVAAALFSHFAAYNLIPSIISCCLLHAVTILHIQFIRPGTEQKGKEVEEKDTDLATWVSQRHG